MELTPEERQKIYLEEKTRLEVRQELQTQGKKTGAGTVMWRVILGVVGVVVLMVLFGSIVENSNTGPSNSTSAANTAVQSTGNVAHDRLLELGASAQALVLGQIVGEGCRGEYAFYMGMDKEANAYWSVRCANGKSYQVQIQPNATGSTSVMDCALLKAVTKLSCFVKMDQR
jgi:hypothetical protein